MNQSERLRGKPNGWITGWSPDRESLPLEGVLNMELLLLLEKVGNARLGESD